MRFSFPIGGSHFVSIRRSAKAIQLGARLSVYSRHSSTASHSQVVGNVLCAQRQAGLSSGAGELRLEFAEWYHCAAALDAREKMERGPVAHPALRTGKDETRWRRTTRQGNKDPILSLRRANSSSATISGSPGLDLARCASPAREFGASPQTGRRP